MLVKCELTITKPDGTKREAIIVVPQVTDDILYACGVEKDDNVVVNIVPDWKRPKDDKAKSKAQADAPKTAD